MHPVDNTWQIAYASGYNASKERSAAKVKKAFADLPATADQRVKDLLLDLYNEIKEVPSILEDTSGATQA